jgi:hypothetical protein
MPDSTADCAGYAVEGYLDLVHRGELRPGDHVEPLDGVIVAVSSWLPRRPA